MSLQPCDMCHLTPISSIYFCVTLHRWRPVVSLFLFFNLGRTQCLSLVCCMRPSWGCWVPCPQDGGPPLWLWWWWEHSLAHGSQFWAVVCGEVPREILWIWCDGRWQGWLTLFAACLMHFVTSLATPAAWAQWTWTFVLELCKHTPSFCALLMSFLWYTTPFIGCCLHTYTSWCVTLLVDVHVSPMDHIPLCLAHFLCSGASLHFWEQHRLAIQR